MQMSEACDGDSFEDGVRLIRARELSFENGNEKQ